MTCYPEHPLRAGVLLFLAWALAATNAISQSSMPGSPIRRPGVKPTPSPSPSPPIDPATDLAPLMKQLGEHSRDYASLALRFLCIETVRTTEDKKDDEQRYDYMYVEHEEQRYRPYRQRHTGKMALASEEAQVDFAFPDAYSWTLMFVPERQHLFHFRFVGREWFSLRNSYILEFDAPLPFTSGKTIYEWMGRVWVDAENLNILKVEAQPGNQADRLKRELSEYRRAPRFLIFPMGSRPRGARYAVTFLNEFRTLSLPDQTEYRSFTLDLEGSEEFDGVVTLRYSGYRFFNVDAKEFLK